MSSTALNLADVAGRDQPIVFPLTGQPGRAAYKLADIAFTFFALCDQVNATAE